MKTGRGGGGLRFSEEDLAYMQSKVRGTNITAGVGSKLPKTVIKSGTDVSFESSEEKTAAPPKTPSNKTVKKQAPNPPSDVSGAEDPDWTAPRTVKVARVKGGKTVNQHITEVIKSIKNAVITTAVSEVHIAIYFDGARLLTLNEILAVFPYQPYLIFAYKKAWKEKIDQALLILKSNAKCKIPEFTESCVFVGFRSSTRLVDRDGLSPCFKYILDDLRNQKALSPIQILKDDNPNLIVETPCYQVQGLHAVGIRLEKVVDWSEPEVNKAKMLSSDPLSSWAHKGID
jgi:hypothetical protein